MNNQSAYQLIKLFVDGLIPKRYRKKVVQWLLGNDDSEAKEEALNTIWNQISDDSDLDIQQALDRFHAKRDAYELRQKAYRLRIRVSKYAAIVLLLIVAGVTVWLKANQYQAQKGKMLECYVENGFTDSLLLSDGTQVYLNSGSIMYYPKFFSKFLSKREVYLEGEAHFDVSKDEDKPFIVHTGNLSIQVLGTNFNVKAYAGERTITTTLEKGRIKVSSNRNTALLLPNDQLVFDRVSGTMRKRHVEGKRYSSWLNGTMIFEQETLESIISALQRKFNVDFRVDPHVDLNKKYTMGFTDYEDINDIMKVLTQLEQNITYKYLNNTIILKRKKGGTGSIG